MDSRISQSWSHVIKVHSGLSETERKIELIDKSSILLDIFANVYYLWSSADSYMHILWNSPSFSTRRRHVSELVSCAP
jgi:hypothetical protein